MSPNTSQSRTTPTLLAIVFTAAATLSVKCSADLIRLADRFPGWFVPVFVPGIAALLGFGAVVTLHAWKHRGQFRWARGYAAAAIWVLLSLSFVSTSAVHGFYPFRPAPPRMIFELDPILRLNMLLTAFGFIGSALCGTLYLLGRQQAAITSLLGLAVLLLVPNDACMNPFNEWWLAEVGASPLMFVPNLFAIVFGTSALIGVHRRLNGMALFAVGLSVGLLGLGHMWHVIW